MTVPLLGAHFAVIYRNPIIVAIITRPVRTLHHHQPERGKKSDGGGEQSNEATA